MHRFYITYLCLSFFGQCVDTIHLCSTSDIPACQHTHTQHWLSSLSRCLRRLALVPSSLTLLAVHVLFLSSAPHPHTEPLSLSHCLLALFVLWPQCVLPGMWPQQCCTASVRKDKDEFGFLGTHTHTEMVDLLVDTRRWLAAAAAREKPPPSSTKSLIKSQVISAR